VFEDLIKQLQGLNGRSISIPIDADEKGYIDKQCPSEQCEFLFKVNGEDWSNIFKDEAVWCPMCRHEAPADQWFTIEQVEHAKSEALKVLKGEINEALRSGAQKFNRAQPRNSFISMSMEVKGGTQRTYTLPAKAADVMQLEIQCEKCSARFAVIGSAYFCPACGANSVVRTFSDSLRKIRAKKDSEETVRQALTDAVGKDEAELTCRSLRETCLSDGVAAFQKYCEGLYEPFGKTPFNAFQRIDEGSELWRTAVGQGYETWLTTQELSSLKVLYQKRHILAHNEGIVDQRYIEKSGDVAYKPGQRLVVAKGDVELLLSLLEKLGGRLGGACDHA
jgi:Zn finger protein HypA/HybF involved in hydrogenase expression